MNYEKLKKELEEYIEKYYKYVVYKEDLIHDILLMVRENDT